MINSRQVSIAENNVTVKVQFLNVLLPLKCLLYPFFIWEPSGHPDITDTSVCPLGVSINGVPSYFFYRYQLRYLPFFVLGPITAVSHHAVSHSVISPHRTREHPCPSCVLFVYSLSLCTVRPSMGNCAGANTHGLWKTLPTVTNYFGLYEL